MSSCSYRRWQCAVAHQGGALHPLGSRDSNEFEVCVQRNLQFFFELRLVGMGQQQLLADVLSARIHRELT